MKCLRLPALWATFFLLSQTLSAQIVDNFSDGDFAQNPTWVGDAANFKISTAGELQLNATGAGQSVLFAAGNLPDSTIWDFDVRLSFAPSGSNLVRIFLQIDQADLALANGYYLEMGETGAADAIRFFRQDGTTKTQLATGQAGLAAESPNLHIRAKRTVSGDWTLEAAPVGTPLQTQFALNETTWPGGASRFFGFQCVYTSSNSTKFYFDNINIRPDVPDTQPPVLLLATADDELTVTAVFDEALDPATAAEPTRYTISNGIGQPLAAALAADGRTVELTLPTPLSTGSYTLQASGLKDVLGNASATQTADFQFVKVEIAEAFDILINEIMSDPTPSRGLPEVEWVELHNRSAKTFDLANFRIADATSSPAALPTFALLPGGYVVLTANANVAVLQAATPNGQVLGIALSTSALNNDGDALTLSDAAGKIIDRVDYGGGCNASAAPYEGVSRERINPNLPCLGNENWRPCPAQIGATLAAQNAAYSTAPDLLLPNLGIAYPESPTSILLTFNKGLDRISAQNPAIYQFSPARTVTAAQQLADNRAQVRLTLATPLEATTTYALTLANGLSDCSGNLAANTDTTYLGLPEKPENQDIVLSEILFNPATGGARYLEFYNRSQKIFDWSEFFLADTSAPVAINARRLFLPGTYHVFSNNPDDIRSRHDNIYPGRVICQGLPSLDDNADQIVLYWAGGGQSLTVDSFVYSRNLHNALLSIGDREGVALERIRLESPTNVASNWTSASALLTGAPGTPTLPNSQSRSTAEPEDELVQIPVARISPDGDNREDFLDILYNLPMEGYFATMTVFDSDGNPVKRLVRQALIGTEGTLRWDGDTDRGEKARPGIHVLFLEIFGPSGEVRRIKKTFAVLGSF
jgi:hypothetical protein